MIVYFLIYLIVLAISGAFFVFYKDILALMLFIVALIIPFILLITSLIMRLCTRISIRSKAGGTVVGESTSISLEISNYSPFPITKLIVYTSQKNSLCGDTDRGELSFFAPPFSKRAYDIEIGSKHAGNVIIEFVSAKIFDYFGIFAFPLKLKKTCVIPIFPKIHPISTRLRRSVYNLDNATVYNKSKSGEDSAEVFEIRDYIDGDRINRIHWKLSAKLDSYVVKDYSLPDNKSVLLLFELFGEAADSCGDAVLEALADLSHMLIEQGVAHTVGWYDNNLKGLSTVDIKTKDDIYTCIGQMYEGSCLSPNPMLSELSANSQINRSNIIYISPKLTEMQFDNLSATVSDFILLSIIEIGNGETDGQTLISENTVLTPVNRNKVSEGLDNIVI